MFPCFLKVVSVLYGFGVVSMVFRVFSWFLWLFGLSWCSWKVHGRFVVFLGSCCTIMKYGEIMFHNLFFSSDSNKKCDCKRCFYQTYSNPVNAIVSFCGNSTEVFLRVNFQKAPGLMFFLWKINFNQKYKIL